MPNTCPAGFTYTASPAAPNAGPCAACGKDLSAAPPFLAWSRSRLLGFCSSSCAKLWEKTVGPLSSNPPKTTAPGPFGGLPPAHYTPKPYSSPCDWCGKTCANAPTFVTQHNGQQLNFCSKACVKDWRDSVPPTPSNPKPIAPKPTPCTWCGNDLAIGTLLLMHKGRKKSFCSSLCIERWRDQNDLNDYLRECLAAWMHEKWADTVRHTLDNYRSGNIGGWTRRIDTPFEDLTELAKALPYHWADEVLELLKGDN